MHILTIRTDKPEAEIGLYDGRKQVAYKQWTAHRDLAETLLHVIDDFLRANGSDIDRLEGIVVFQGPGSFTGLRIGATVGNALAFSRALPIIGQVAAEAGRAEGQDWIAAAIGRLMEGETDTAVLPFYGADANITKPRK